MKISVVCFVFVMCLGETLASEVKRRSTRSRYRFTHQGFSPVYPFVNSYVGPVRHKVVIRCRANAESAPDIQWYRLVPDNSTCENQNRTLTNIEGKFCTEARTRLFVQSRHRYTKYISKLIIRSPGIRDSGIYVCVISSRNSTFTVTTKPVNVTHMSKLAFHRTEEPPIRVVGGLIYGQGSVELFVNNEWRGINPNTWGFDEAKLFCRLLGYDKGAEPVGGIYLYKWPLMNLLSLDCPLNSTGLSDCTGFNETEINRPRAGVRCRSQAAVLRFAGPSPSEGRVEVYYQGLWWSVCIKNITAREISTICRIMGYNYGGVAEIFWHPDNESPIILGKLQCPSNASGLEQCTYTTKTSCCGCYYLDDSLAVRCRVGPDEDSPSSRVRLAAYGSDKKGRVEVYYEKRKMWVTVDADYLQAAEANMFCKMLGFQYGGEPMTAVQGYEKMHINSMSCPLNASTIENCNVEWEGYWTAREPGGVECREDPLEVPIVPFRIGRNEEGEGMLQYYEAGYWGTVCKFSVGTPEASMMCSMMGHRDGRPIYYKQKYYNNYRKDRMIIIMYCPRGVDDLRQCFHTAGDDWDWDCLIDPVRAGVSCIP